MTYLSIVGENIAFFAIIVFLLLLGLSYYVGEKLRHRFGKRREEKERAYFEGKPVRKPSAADIERMKKRAERLAKNEKGGIHKNKNARRPRSMTETEKIFYSAVPNFDYWQRKHGEGILSVSVQTANEIVKHELEGKEA